MTIKAIPVISQLTISFCRDGNWALFFWVHAHKRLYTLPSRSWISTLRALHLLLIRDYGKSMLLLTCLINLRNITFIKGDVTCSRELQMFLGDINSQGLFLGKMWIHFLGIIMSSQKLRLCSHSVNQTIQIRSIIISINPRLYKWNSLGTECTPLTRLELINAQVFILWGQVCKWESNKHPKRSSAKTLISPLDWTTTEVQTFHIPGKISHILIKVTEIEVFHN